MRKEKQITNWRIVASEILSTIIFLLILSPSINGACFATTVQLQWDPNTEPDLVGYKVYYNADSADFPFEGTGANEGAAPIDVRNQTTATVSGLDPGHSYYFAVTAYYSSGMETSYSNIASVPELVVPTVSITYPVNETTISGTISIAADASDNAGVTKVELYANGVLKGTVSSSPYVYSLDTSSLAVGSNKLMAMAYDEAGNVGRSDDVSVTVVKDTAPPTVSISAPAKNATISKKTTITASASDNVGVSRVEFYVDGALLSASNVAPYSYVWDTETVANGAYVFSAVAYDAAGNSGQSSNVPVTVNNPDVTAPTATAFTMPSTATSLTVAVTAFTATDNVGVTGYMITESATKPSASVAGWTSSAPASYTFSGSGAKTAYAWAKDAVGNVSGSLSRSVTITLPDTTAPTVTLTAPVNNAEVSGTVSITATASDNVGVSKVEFYLNGVLKSTDTTSPYSYSWNTAEVTDGGYVLSVKAYDAKNNMGQSAGVQTTVKNTESGSTGLVQGDIDGDGAIDIGDALMALKTSAGIIKPTSNQLARGDVAPLVNGKPQPNGKVDLGDAIVLLRRIAGLVMW